MDEDMVLVFPSVDDLMRAARVRAATCRAAPGGAPSGGRMIPSFEPESGKALSAVVRDARRWAGWAGERRDVHRSMGACWASVPVRTKRAEALVECVEWLRGEGSALESACRTLFRSVSVAVGVSCAACVDACERAISSIKRRDDLVRPLMSSCVAKCQEVERVCAVRMSEGVAALDRSGEQAAQSLGEEAGRRALAKIRGMRRPSSRLAPLLAVLPPDTLQWEDHLKKIKSSLRDARWSERDIERELEPIRTYAYIQNRAESDALRIKSLKIGDVKRDVEKRVADFRAAIRSATRQAVYSECSPMLESAEGLCLSLESTCDKVVQAVRREGKKAKNQILHALATDEEMEERLGCDDESAKVLAEDLSSRAEMFAYTCDHACAFVSETLISACRCFLFDGT
jgi:hypothetical protein